MSGILQNGGMGAIVSSKRETTSTAFCCHVLAFLKNIEKYKVNWLNHLALIAELIISKATTKSRLLVRKVLPDPWHLKTKPKSDNPLAYCHCMLHIAFPLIQYQNSCKGKLNWILGHDFSIFVY